MQKKLHFTFLKKVILLVTLITGMNMWGQITIASQDFELVPATPTLTFIAEGGNFSSGTNTNGSPNANFFASGARGYFVSNGTATLTFANQSLSGYSSNYVDLRVAGMSVNSTGNGMEAADYMQVEISLDGGTSYSSEVRIVGSSNTAWGFAGSGSSNITYDGNNSPTTVPSPAGNTGISTVRVNLPESSTQVRVKITLLNNAANERWVIDDVRIRGTIASPVVTSIAASDISATGATFNGTVSAASTTVTTSFEYGTTTSYGNTASNTTPSSVTGTTSTPFSAPVTGLAVNTQYHFRAVGNNGTIYNGSDLTFYTLANVPATVAIDNPGVYTLNITLDGVSVNSNPASTQFAIQETGGQYVQANGSLGASPYWATADNWQNKTVTGLSAATTYTFHAKARNGANVETAFGATAQEVTLPNTSPLLYADTLASFTTPVGSTATNMATIFGDNLTNADVTVGPLAGFTFSTTLEGTYTNTLTFTQPGNSFSEEFYVKFTPVAAQSYNGNIPVSGGGASTINIAVTATGVAPTAALSGTLGEASLNGGSFTVTLSNGTFNNPLTAADFTLNGAPAGVTLAGVTYISPTTATLVLAYDDTDFDNTPSISVTIAPSQTTSNLQITSGTLSISPVIESIVSNGTLSFTSQVCINQTADSSFGITGTVKAGTINLTAANGYSFSLTNGSGYTSTLSFPVNAGVLSQTIYVRFAPIAAQAYNSSTTISGGSAASIIKNISGTGNNTVGAVTTNTVSTGSISASGATLSGRVTTVGICPASIERGFVYSITSVNGTPEVGGTGVTQQSVAGMSTTTYTFNATDLTAGTSYRVRAYVYDGSTYTYANAVTFSTLAPPPSNDLCTNPDVIVVDAPAIQGTLESATLSPITNSLDDYSDVWYTFTPTCSGSHTITLSNFAGDMDVYVFDQACPTDMLTYVNYSASSATTELVQATLLAGTSYTIRISAYLQPLTTFNLQVTSAISAPIVTTGAVENLASSSASIEVSVLAGCGNTTGERGVVYATTQNPAIGAASTAVGAGDGTFTAQLTGLANNTTYYVRAYATNNTGTSYSQQISFTTYHIDAPVAEEESALTIGGVGFNANWQEVAGATGYRLDVSESETFAQPANATDLFFSEYVEGNFTERYIEIYNGTGASVNLNQYSVVMYSNGSTSTSGTVTLSGTLGTGQTFVIRNAGATNWMGNANLVNSAITQFTGNDVLELRKNSTAIDRIGIVGDGSSFAQDVTLRRKSSILSPSAQYNIADWDVYATDNVSGLGTHTFNGLIGFYVSGYEDKVVTGTSAPVTGLVEGNTYYYRVRAVSNTGASNNSNVITATAKAYYVWNGNAWAPQAPSNLDIAVIAGDYNTGDLGTFEAGSLIIDSGILTVASGTTLEIEGTIENHATAANFIVEHDGFLMQNGDVENVGDATIFRDSNELFKLDYTMWSSPVTGQNLFDFSPATVINRFYAYGTLGAEQYYSVSASNGYAANNGSAEFIPGRGYHIRMPNELVASMDGFPENTDGYNAGTFSTIFHGQFAGVPNNGTITLDYAFEGGFNGVGNPYPSPVNVAAFFMDNAANLADDFGIFFWRKKNNADATSYAVLTMDGYAANDGGIESDESGGEYNYGGQQWETYYATTDDTEWTIAPGQGFFAKARAGAQGITFTNSMRQNPVGGQPFFRNGESEPVEKSKLWFNLSAPGQGFSQTTLIYNPVATLGLDFGRDARHFSTSGFTAIYTLTGEDQLVIQARPAFDAADVVPVGYRVNNAGEFYITLHRTEGVFEGDQEVFLKDNLLNVTHNIKDGAYTFITEAGTFNNRFEIVYTNNALGTDKHTIDANSVVVYKQDNVIKVNTGNIIMDNVVVYDLRGRVIYNQKDINASQATLTGLVAEQQILLVEVITPAGRITKKVIY